MPAGGDERRHRRPVRTAAQHPTPSARAALAPAPSSSGALGGSLGVDFAQLVQQGGPQSWDCLPHTCLQGIFDRLELRDLAAAASVCPTWHYEASLDTRWRAFWQQQVSDVGLWRWAKADGGYRQQLRAKHLVRRGDCVASVFPFSRRDGPVSEVLFFDGGPHDADKRVLTVQAPKAPGQSVRLHGSCLKVWDATALMVQHPLLTVHDVLKHMQLEDGRLFLWRIADDAVVPASCFDPGDPEVAEAAFWAEHPAIRASVLEPGALVLRDVPLEATYGRGMAPAEWLDMSGGLVAGSLMVPSQGHLTMRLFDLATGRCLRTSSCMLHTDEAALQFHDHEVTMIVTRSGEAGSLVAATCALFDTRTFVWRLRDEWIVAGQQAADAADAAAGSSVEKEQRLVEARAAAWDAAATTTVVAAASPGSTEGDCGQYELRHVYTTLDDEPIVDISISTSAHRLFVVGMEHIFIADLSGVPFMRVSLARWRGIVPPGQVMAPADVGAFSWPLPNSTKTAFFLDSTQSLFIAEFRRPQMSDFWYMQHAGQGSAATAGRHPHFDHHIAEHLHAPGQGQRQQGAVDVTYYVQSHTDLRPSPTAPLLSTVHGRPAGPRAVEPGIVEYTQDGGVLITSGDTSCPAVAALLGHEKAAWTYLDGLGPRSAKPRSGGGGGTAGGALGRRQPFISHGGRGQQGQLAPRALVLIDTSSGCRYKAVPLEGVCESVHSAGQYVVLSVAELGSYPDGLNGSLVVLDFGGCGLGGLSEPATAAATPQPRAADKQQRRRRQRRGRRLRGGSLAAAATQQEEEEVQEEEQQQQKKKEMQQQPKARRCAKPKSKQMRGGARGRTAPAAPMTAEEEAGPSRKRGKY